MAAFVISIGQSGFCEYFILSIKGQGAAYINHIFGAVNALFSFGTCVGALGGGPLANKIGRKWTLSVAALTNVIGGALAAGSIHVAMPIVVRILRGSGFGALVSTYLVEASTPPKRGMLTGLHRC